MRNSEPSSKKTGVQNAGIIRFPELQAALKTNPIPGCFLNGSK
jgi:hypothetical protein